VLLLSDGYIANGSEPWLLPEVSELPDLTVEFAKAPNGPDGEFLPYLRDPATLARPWAVPGTKGLEHRIGGLEKADKTGDISYDPANHDFMVRTRAARIEAIEVPDVEVDDPDGTARALVLGWGSTYGPIGAACRSLRQRGLPIAQAHLRHLNPMPKNLGAVLRRFERVVIPEMNLGQLAHVIRGRYLVDAIPYNQVRGLPFTAAELETMLEEVVKNA
jgi:2-oxoglutarate ferredoxin oxidoreductase subunit alpha